MAGHFLNIKSPNKSPWVGEIIELLWEESKRSVQIRPCMLRRESTGAVCWVERERRRQHGLMDEVNRLQLPLHSSPTCAGHRCWSGVGQGILGAA